MFTHTFKCIYVTFDILRLQLFSSVYFLQIFYRILMELLTRSESTDIYEVLM